MCRQAGLPTASKHACRVGGCRRGGGRGGGSLLQLWLELRCDHPALPCFALLYPALLYPALLYPAFICSTLPWHALQEGLVTHKLLSNHTALELELRQVTCHIESPAHKQLIAYDWCLHKYGTRHQFMGGWVGGWVGGPLAADRVIVNINHVVLTSAQRVEAAW